VTNIKKSTILALCLSVFVCTSACTTPPAPPEPVEFGLYAPILNAYAELERSDFEVCDEGLIGDSSLIYIKERTVKWDMRKPTLIFALYDINQDGIKELLIGARTIINDTPYAYIYGIYALRNGKPVSVIQQESRYNLRLSSRDDGKPIIEYSYGRMDVAWDYFYAIDENSMLRALDKLYTDGCDRTDENNPIYLRKREIDGAQAVVTEVEYWALIRKYGAGGYGDISGAVPREIELSWVSIDTIQSW
jgi:hypothetical protein